MRRRTPLRPVSRPAREPAAATCDGFIVETEQRDPLAAVAVARAALRKVIGGDRGWRLKPIAPQSREVDLTPPSGWTMATPGAAFETARRLERQRHVVSAEPTFIAPGLYDPRRLSLRARSGLGDGGVNPDCEWSLKLAKVPEAWSLAPAPGGQQFGGGIVVGHPDTGYTTHPEIWETAAPQQRVRSDLGCDYVEGDQVPLDDLEGGVLDFPGHGTSTASVIMSGVGAPAGGASFVSGVAPKAELVPFRVSRTVVHFSMKNVTKAIAQCSALGLHVVSMSLGGPFPSRALERTIRAALDEGVILLAAAGNYWPWVVYPAAYDEVVAVAACDYRGQMWRWSATGGTVDVTAPGENVWVAGAEKSALPLYSVRPGSGTSFAVATTAAIAALWLAHHGRDNLIATHGKAHLARVFLDLLTTAGVDTPPEWDADNWGAGIVNAEKLLRAAPARGLPPRVRGPRPVRRPWLHYFPDLDPDAVEQALAEVLRARRARLPALLERLGDEVVFLLATEPGLRDEVRARAAGGRGVRATRALRSPVRSTWRRNASPTLRAQVAR